jgi:hypothetical protein
MQSHKPVVTGTIIAQLLKPKMAQFEWSEYRCRISKAINCPGAESRHNGLNTDVHIHIMSLPKMQLH